MDSNGVIRISKKGIKKFAIGNGGAFDLDIVQAFTKWIQIDESFREDDRTIKPENMPEFHQSAIDFVSYYAAGNVSAPITTAEALDFLARLREQYEELANFFQPKLSEEPESRDTSGEVSVQFSEESA